MDPLTIIGTTTGLVVTCVKVANTLNDLRGRYSRSGLTISAISTECTVISAALSQLGRIAQDDPDRLSTRLSVSNGQLAHPLELALDSCTMTMDLLDEEIKKIMASEKGPLLSWRGKMKYV
jgi:hypothetical protein